MQWSQQNIFIFLAKHFAVWILSPICVDELHSYVQKLEGIKKEPSIAGVLKLWGEDGDEGSWGGDEEEEEVG